MAAMWDGYIGLVRSLEDTPHGLLATSVRADPSRTEDKFGVPERIKMPHHNNEALQERGTKRPMHTNDLAWEGAINKGTTNTLNGSRADDNQRRVTYWAPVHGTTLLGGGKFCVRKNRLARHAPTDVSMVQTNERAQGY